MRLSVLPISTYAQINIFDYAVQWKIRAGDNNTLIFQVIDLDQDKIRYMVGAPSDLQPAAINVTFPSLDDCKVIVAPATQVDPNDKSIWSVTLSSIQTPASGNVQFQINENGTIRRFQVKNLIQVEYSSNDGAC